MAFHYLPPKNINQKTVVACPKSFEDRSLQYALATVLCENNSKTPSQNLKNIRKTMEKLGEATGFTDDVFERAKLKVNLETQYLLSEIPDKSDQRV